MLTTEQLTHLSSFSQKIINAARSKWRLVRDSSITCTAQRPTLASNFISSYLIWNAQTEKEHNTVYKGNIWSICSRDPVDEKLHKKISLLATELSASQEGLCSM
jgi:hypothetical protein